MQVLQKLITWCSRRQLAPFYVAFWIKHNSTWTGYEWYSPRHNIMQLLPDSQDILLKFPDFSRVSLTTELIPWLYQGFQGFHDHLSTWLNMKSEIWRRSLEELQWSQLVSYSSPLGTRPDLGFQPRHEAPQLPAGQTLINQKQWLTSGEWSCPFKSGHTIFQLYSWNYFENGFWKVDSNIEVKTISIIL